MFPNKDDDINIYNGDDYKGDFDINYNNNDNGITNEKGNVLNWM